MDLLALPRRALTDSTAAAFRAVAAARHDKPIHADGATTTARLVRTGAPEPFGVPWLDEPGEDPAVVRFSRTFSVPVGGWDVDGLALRFTDGTGDHDLVLATTGSAPLLRHVFVPHRGLRALYGSLLPYSTPTGPAMIAIRPTPDPQELELLVARPLGPWSSFGRLLVDDVPPLSPHSALAFDPVRHPLPGMRWAPAVADLRERAYAAARLGRGDQLTT